MSGFTCQPEGLCGDPPPIRSNTQWAMVSSLPRLHYQTQTHHTRQDSSGPVISPTQRPLPEKTHNTHKRQTFLPPAGFELAIPASERPQTHTLDNAATGIGLCGDSVLQYTVTASTCFAIQHSAPSRRTVQILRFSWPVWLNYRLLQ